LRKRGKGLRKQVNINTFVKWVPCYSFTEKEEFREDSTLGL
jgi:hypothetical protein